MWVECFFWLISHRFEKIWKLRLKNVMRKLLAYRYVNWFEFEFLKFDVKALLFILSVDFITMVTLYESWCNNLFWNATSVMLSMTMYVFSWIIIWNFLTGSSSSSHIGCLCHITNTIKLTSFQQANKEYLERSMSESQNNLREMIKLKQSMGVA